MPDNSYKIKLEIDKGDASAISEDLKKMMSTFQDVTKSLKPLADSFNNAFGPKTLESLTKISTIFTNLERTLDSLSNKTDRFGSTIERVAGSRGMQQMGGAAKGVIFDQFGRPIDVGAEAPAGATPAGVAPTTPRTDMFTSMAGAARKLGIPGSDALYQLAGSMGPIGRTLGGAGMIAGGAIQAYNTGYDAYYRTQLAMIERERMGRASAMAGRPGERFVMGGAGELTTADYLRAGGGAALGVGAGIGAGALAGSAIGAAGGPIGILGGALLGGAWGLAKAVPGYFESINRAQQMRLGLNRELGQGVDRAMDYVGNVEHPELIYGSGAADAMIRGGGGYGGLDRRTDLLTRMSRAGMRIGAGGSSSFDAMVALENKYNLGAISSFGQRAVANLNDFDIEGFKRVVAESGYGGLDQMAPRGMIADSVMGMAAQRGIYNQAASQNLLGMGFQFAAPYQNMSAEFQQRVSGETFGRRSGAMQSGFGQAFMHQRLFNMGVKNPFAAQAIQTNLESGNIARAQDIAKSIGVNLSQSDLNSLVGGAMGGAQQVLKATGVGAEYVGDIFTADEAQQASIRNVLSGRAAGTLGRPAGAGGRGGARAVVEDTLEGRDTRAMQTATAQMTQFEEVLNLASQKFGEFQEIVRVAGEEFNAAVLKGLKADAVAKNKNESKSTPTPKVGDKTK